MAGEEILIVDDNATNVKLLSFLLSSRGYRVQVAVDGEEALALLETYRPKLILMDLQLPGIDGLSVTRKLREQPATADILVVAVTASAMKGDEHAAIAAGCDGYITKPIDTRALPAQVAAYLARAGADR
jgi:CheY-like chemotaxis protein